MTVGDRIKELRKNKDMAQVELAEKIGVSKQTMYKYENNIVTNIPSDVIEIIAKVLNVSESYLMGWEEISLHRLSLDSFYTSEDGHKLISSYLSLNEQGKKNLLEHCDLLLSSEKYRAELSPSIGQLYLFEDKYTEPYKENEVLNAAHERTDIEVTDEMRKHDDDIMDDEHF